MQRKDDPSLYQAWQGMRRRCLTPSTTGFKDYGGRGIKICPEWDSFTQFAQDMGQRPPNTSLDRRDNDGDYTPDNCRWATKKEQQRNRRVVRRVIIEGHEYLAAELADRSGLKTDTILARVARGLTLAEVLDPARRVFLDGLKLGGKANGERQRKRTHCINGHEFTLENTYVNKNGNRTCRKCHCIRMASKKAAA